MRIFAAGLFVSILTPALAFAASFPSPSDICDRGIVVKEKLAKAILKQNPDALKLYVDANDGPDTPAIYKPQWRRIFLDEKFCKNDTGCLAPSIEKKAVGNEKPPLDYSAAKDTLGRLREQFSDALVTNVTGTYYEMARPGMGVRYLEGEDSKNRIRCVGPDYPVAQKPFKLSSPVRLRANSDDLNIDASGDTDQKNAFKKVKPATITYTQDGIPKTNTAKLQAAIGYPISLPFSPEMFSFFNGEAVPYISATQTFTKTAGKAATLADTNTVAVGALVNMQGILRDVGGLKSVFYAKPQYIWNTKDKSEIANVSFVYAPWTDGVLKINTDIPISGFLPEDSWLTLLFDVRDYVGKYNNVGIDPVTSLTNRSYHRAGTRFGFALATPEQYAHIVLNVTETLLYGFSGSVRQLDLFEANLSVYFDSTNNFAFTLAYTKGMNVDTAERAQIWTAGLSAKF